jgi:hypothetical protein
LMSTSSTTSTLSTISSLSSNNTNPNSNSNSNRNNAKPSKNNHSSGQRNTTGSSLKKHLNLLKTNSKKVLLGQSSNHHSSHNTNNSNNDKNTNQSNHANSSTNSINSLSPLNQSKASEFNESAFKLRELQTEIGKYEEKMLSLKKIAEEKQIESAALKYEYRKVQELKDNLLSENAYLKSMLNNQNNANTLMIATSTTTLNYNSPRLNQNNTSNLINKSNNNSISNLSSNSPHCSSTTTSTSNLQIQGKLIFTFAY